MFYLIDQESLLFRHPGVSLLEIKASLVRGVPGDDRGNEVVALRFLDSFPVPPPGLAATSLSAPASAAASGPAQVLHVVVEPVLPERAAIHSSDENWFRFSTNRIPNIYKKNFFSIRMANS